MRSNRSILEKIADTARGIAKIASDAADRALEPERPADRRAFARRSNRQNVASPQPRSRSART
jgi:hypothetical protein